MHELVLNYKGHSMSVFFKNRSFYVRTEFEAGKTIYHLLFEHLVDGRTVSCKGFARKYGAQSEFLNGKHVRSMMQRILEAAKKSQDKALKRMRFATLPQGGANPVLLRQSTEARFSQQQNRVIAQTINSMYADRKKHSYAEIRMACLAALRRQHLAENVVLSPLKIWKVKRALGFSIARRPKHPRRRK